ncbi:MAG: orotate phosphoribosyltransferase [Thermoleophilaceae bacterium]|nr:orotate phosphoribosyltransferase [Thermoleophilaceae bacterium]
MRRAKPESPGPSLPAHPRRPCAPLASVSDDARQRLIVELREHALVKGRVTLSSGNEADYYVDAKRAILRPAGFLALGELVAEQAGRLGAGAVGGLTMGADPVACAALAAGAQVKAFFVRKDRKAHGLQRWVEGPRLDEGERCLIVEDVVTTGGSTIAAIERVREEGLEVVGVVSVLDRLAGGGPAIEAAAGAPYLPLTTIDDLYPERADR